ALGMLNVRIITHRDPGPLVQNLRRANFGVTLVEGRGATGPVRIAMTVIKRKQLPHVTAIIHRFDPHTFYAVDELQTASAGIFPMTRTEPSNPLPFPLELLAESEQDPQGQEKLPTPLAG